MKADDVVTTKESLLQLIESSTASKRFFEMCTRTETVFAHISDNVTSNYNIVTNKLNRQPTNTPEYIHNYFDIVLENMFGVAYRSNALFGYTFNINDIPNGVNIAIPYGDDFSMMYIDGVTDFYYTIERAYNNVARDIVSDLNTAGYTYPLINAVVDFLKDIDEEDQNVESILLYDGLYKRLPKETVQYISSPKFMKDLKSLVMDYVDMFSKKALEVDNATGFANIVNEEVHLHSEKFIFINPELFKDIMAS